MSQPAAEEPIRCWRCSLEHPVAFFCPGCGAVQRPSGDSDYFALLGLPAHPAVDPAELERRYHELSRRLHPDRYQMAPVEEREASSRATAVLNSAFRTLRDLETRGRYWLAREGEQLGRDNNRVPPGLAAYVFEVQEQLGELREAQNGDRAAITSRLGETQRELLARRDRERAQLDGLLRAWPDSSPEGAPPARVRAAARAELKRLLSELSYLGTLARDLDTALEG
jgi:curved DNA-binding protein CbpA